MQLIHAYRDQVTQRLPKPPRFAEALTNFLKKFDCHTFVRNRVGQRLQLCFAMPSNFICELRGRVCIDGTVGYLSVAIEARQSIHTERLDVCGLVRLCRNSQSVGDAYCLKVHPEDGHTSIFFGTILPPHLLTHYQVLELVEEQLILLKKSLLARLQKIKCIRSYCHSELNGLPESRRDGLPLRQSIDELKKYITTSTGYAWKVVIPKDNPMEDKATMKRNFREGYSKASPVHRNLCMESIMFGPVAATEKFFILSSGDDAFAYQNYLQKQTELAEDDLLVRKLRLEEDQLQLLIQTSRLKLKNGLTLQLRILKNKDVERELAALRQLPRIRYPTLPIYYEITGIPVEAGYGYLVNSVPEGIMYTHFLRQNAHVLNLYTLLRFLNDMARTLLHLRNHDVISNTLVPFEVRVIKGMQLHLNVLGNSCHSTLEGRSIKSKQALASRSQQAMRRNINTRQPTAPEQPIEGPLCRNILPYVSHTHLGTFYSHTSEMSDVYSFGLMMFRTLFGRQLFDIRRNRLNQLSDFEAMRLMCDHKPVFVLERLNHFGMDHMKVLANFTFMACCHHAPGLVNPELQPTESVNSMLSSRRPYLDWVVVVVESATQFFQRQYQI